MKEEWYQFVIDNKQYWANGFTVKRLEKIKEKVFNHNHTMNDLLNRHGGSYLTPDEMIIKSLDQFNHCVGNFVGNISSILRA